MPIVPPSRSSHQTVFAVRGRIHQLHRSPRRAVPPRPPPPVPERGRLDAGSPSAGLPAGRGAEGARAGGSSADGCASRCPALGPRLPRAREVRESEEEEEEENRAADPAGWCRWWELWLNGCSTGVERGSGVSAGLQRKALTALGRRGAERAPAHWHGSACGPQLPTQKRESGRWEQGKQITRPQPDGCYFWLGVGSFSNYAAEMFRR